MVVEVGEEVYEVDFALEDRDLVAALVDLASLERELVLLVLGIGDIAEVADFVIGEVVDRAIGESDLEFVILAKFFDRVDEDLLTNDVAFLDGIHFGHFVDIDIGRDSLGIDNLADDAHTILVEKAVDEGVEIATESAVGNLVSLFEGANSFKFFGTGGAALVVFVVELNRFHNTEVEPDAETYDNDSQDGFDDDFRYFIHNNKKLNYKTKNT